MSRLIPLLTSLAFGLACPDAERETASAPAGDWPTGDLVAVDVVDESRVLVVAASAEIHLSLDAGASWRKVDGPRADSMHAIDMADAEVGWVVGAEHIAKTTDGGFRWQLQSRPPASAALDLSDVEAIDRNRAVAIGRAGVRLWTADGGAFWQAVAPDVAPGIPGDGARPAVGCISAKPGTCASAGATIHRTRNAGRSWQRVEIEPIATIEPVVFGPGEVEIDHADEKHIAETLERLLEGGDSELRIAWQLEPEVSRAEIDHANRQRDPDALFELMAARIDEVRAMLEKAGVPGDQIEVQASPPWDYGDYLDDDPHFLDRYWADRSAANSAVRVRPIDSSMLDSIAIGDDGLGLAVGERGLLLRSEDGGSTWQRGERISGEDLFAVGFGAEHAIVAGAEGGLFVSDDGGRSWQPASVVGAPAFFDALHAVSFSATGRVGLTVGEHGRILRSLDGGRSWQALAPERS